MKKLVLLLGASMLVDAINRTTAPSTPHKSIRIPRVWRSAESW